MLIKLLNISGLLIFLFVPVSSIPILPEEIPSAAQIFYSTVPQVKKGVDSKFGFGFRLGNHADFQVLYELGPQKYTKPLGKKPVSLLKKRKIDPAKLSSEEKYPVIVRFFDNLAKMLQPPVNKARKKASKQKKLIHKESIKAED